MPFCGAIPTSCSLSENSPIFATSTALSQVFTFKDEANRITDHLPTNEHVDFASTLRILRRGQSHVSLDDHTADTVHLFDDLLDDIALHSIVALLSACFFFHALMCGTIEATKSF
jgi:hypothetical protein